MLSVQKVIFRTSIPQTFIVRQPKVILPVLHSDNTTRKDFLTNYFQQEIITARALELILAYLFSLSQGFFQI